jgi:DNA recombination protein RmuC
MADYILLTAVAVVMLGLGGLLGRLSRGAEIARLEERERAALSQKDERFENLTNRVLRGAAADFATNSLTQLQATIEPLQSTITAVREAVAAETRERVGLGGQIHQLVTTTGSVSQEANNLATVLRGNVQVRCRWGEVGLERILENANLVKNRDYIEQGVGLGLVDENGSPQKPDIIINLAAS